MANHLVRNGHDILKVEDSEKDPRFKVFLFEDSAALHNTMKQFHRGGCNCIVKRQTKGN